MSSQPPKVSVVIPVYNRASLIDACVASAVDQAFEAFEVVLVDNASDDGTWERCQDWAARSARVRAVRNDHNVGPVLNWRRGLEEARGELVKLLFSDDTMAPTYLQETVPFMARPEVGLVFTQIRVGPTPAQARTTAAWRPTTGLVPSRALLRDHLLGRAPTVSPGAALLRRRDALANLVIERPAEVTADWLGHGAGPDVLLYLLTARAYAAVAYVASPLTFFRAHAGSFTMGSSREHVRRSYEQTYRWFAAQEGARWLGSRLEQRLWLRSLARKTLSLPPCLRASAAPLDRVLAPAAMTCEACDVLLTKVRALLRDPRSRPGEV